MVESRPDLARPTARRLGKAAIQATEGKHMPIDFKEFQSAFGNIESVCDTLESVARKYTEGSDEYKAIKMVAEALLFAFSEHAQSSFRSWLENLHRPLTEKERAHLRSMNIDPDTGRRDET